MPQEPGVRFAQDAFLEAYYAKMLPILEQILDQMVRPDQYLQLDSLEIDLGTITLDFEHPELTFKLEAALRKSLTRAFEERRTLELSEADFNPRNVTESQILFHFLETGQAPSWMKAQQLSPPKLLSSLLQGRAPSFFSELSRILSLRAVQRRLAWSFSPDLKAQVVGALLPQYHNDLMTQMRDLQQLQNAKSILPLRASIFEFHLWESLFGAIPGMSVSSLTAQQVFLRLTERLLPSTVFSGAEATWLLRESLDQLGKAKVSSPVAEAIAYLEQLHAAKVKTFAQQMSFSAEKAAFAEALFAQQTMPQAEKQGAKRNVADAAELALEQAKKQDAQKVESLDLLQEQQVPENTYSPETQKESTENPGDNKSQLLNEALSEEEGAHKSTLKEDQSATENAAVFSESDEIGEVAVENLPANKKNAAETEKVHSPEAKTEKEESENTVIFEGADSTLDAAQKSKVDSPKTENQEVANDGDSEIVSNPKKQSATNEEIESADFNSKENIAEKRSKVERFHPNIDLEDDENVAEETHVLGEDSQFVSKNPADSHLLQNEKVHSAKKEGIIDPDEKEAAVESEVSKSTAFAENKNAKGTAQAQNADKNESLAVENDSESPKSLPPEIEGAAEQEVLLDPIQERFKKFREMWATNPEALIPQSNSEALHIPWKTDAETGFEVPFAGLILLWPFIPHLFRALGWMEKSAFVDEEAQWRAIIMLHFLATGADEIPDEQNLAVCKLLVGLQANDPVPVLLELNDAQRKEGHGLLEAVIANWAILKKTKPDGLRLAFLNRNGFLRKDDQGWHLKIERQTTDVLIDRIPWGISTIRLSWQPKMIFVEW